MLMVRCSDIALQEQTFLHTEGDINKNEQLVGGAYVSIKGNMRCPQKNH